MFSQFIDLSHIKQLSQHKVSHLHSISLGENLLNDESLELLTSLKFDNLRYLYLCKSFAMCREEPDQRHKVFGETETVGK